MSAASYPSQPLISQDYYELTYPELPINDPFSIMSTGVWDVNAYTNPHADTDLAALITAASDSNLDDIIRSWDLSSLFQPGLVPVTTPVSYVPQIVAPAAQITGPIEIPQQESIIPTQPTSIPEPTLIPSHHSPSHSAKTEPSGRVISAIDLFQANVRYNPDFRNTGLLPWDKIDITGGIAREEWLEAQGLMSFTPATWIDAFKHLGKQQFLAYYSEQVQCARVNNWSLAPLPAWLETYCFGKRPSPNATGHSVAKRLLTRGNSNHASSSQSSPRRQRHSPYARP